MIEPKNDKVEKHSEPKDGHAAEVGPEGRAVGAPQVTDALKGRTNASDGSLRKYQATEGHLSIELVSDGQVVSRKNTLKEKDLAAPHTEKLTAHVEPKDSPVHRFGAHTDDHSPQALERAQKIAQNKQHIDHLGLDQAHSFKAADLVTGPKPASAHAELRPALESDGKSGQLHHDAAHESTSLKKLKDDMANNFEVPRMRQEFSNNLERFQARTDIDQAEKDRVYMQLSRLLTASDTKLVGSDTKLVRKDGHIVSDDKHLSALDSTEKDALRLSLAEGLIYHAAHPSRVDQGDFNTCNVSTLAERLFTRHPSMAAEMAVTTAIKGEWVNPRDKNHKVIKIDRESLQPAQFGADNVPPADGFRSFDIQILNVVMTNDYWQREVPPMKYLQTKTGTTIDAITGKSTTDNGERLYQWDANSDTCLAPATLSEMTRHGEIKVPIRSPHMIDQNIADEGLRLTGESHFVITNSPPQIDLLTGKPKDDGMVHVTSPEMFRQALIEMKAQHRFPAVIRVDAHSAIFEGISDSRFQPHSGHVISIRDYNDSNGRATISNQWGEKFDMKVNLADLYDASVWNERKTGDWQYELEKWKVQKFGNIEAANES